MSLLARAQAALAVTQAPHTLSISGSETEVEGIEAKHSCSSSLSGLGGIAPSLQSASRACKAIAEHVASRNPLRHGHTINMGEVHAVH